jgi:hypothetical protein
MNNFQIYVTGVFIVKLCFILLVAAQLYISSYKSPYNVQLLENIEFWKNRFEFIFIAAMSFMLLFLFNVRVNNLGYIHKETRLLLFLFGIILLITAKWQLFFKDSVLLKETEDGLKVITFLSGFAFLLIYYI